MPKSNASSIKIHNAAGVRTALPIDFNGSAFTTFGDSKYIPFFAPDDNTFTTLLEARLLSTTHSACIGDKSLYALGEGLHVQDEDLPIELNGNMNSKRESINDILKDAFENIYTDGNKFIEVTRTKLSGKYFIHVHAHNNMDCRFEDNGDDDPIAVLRSKQFRNAGILSLDKPIRIPLWSDDSLRAKSAWVKDTKHRNVERTIIHLKNRISGIDPYGLPSFYAGLLQVMLEYKVARFNMDNFDNNMFLGGLLYIQGNLSDAEEKRLTKNIRDMYSGDGKQNRILTLSSENEIKDTKFVPFTQTHEGHFIEFDKRNEEKIIAAHQWSKDLLDLKNQSGLGKGGDYLKNLFKMKYQTIIKPTQDMVMKNFLHPLFSIMDDTLKTKLSDLPFYLKPVIPIQFEGELDINSLLTVDEGRDAIGKSALGSEKGNQLISEVGSSKVNKNETVK